MEHHQGLCMRYETVTTVNYSLRLGCDAWFRLKYRVTEGPTPKTELWFLVEMEELKPATQELSEITRAA